MFCRLCGKDIESNKELKHHLLSNHEMDLADYFRFCPSATKYCSRCKKELPLTEFYIDRRNRYGYRTRCVRCMRPEGEKSECPLCHRIFQRSAVVKHLKEHHGVSHLRVYPRYVKDKLCTRCNTVKPLGHFYRLRNGCYFSYCKQCNSDRRKSHSIGAVRNGGRMDLS